MLARVWRVKRWAVWRRWPVKSLPIEAQAVSCWRQQAQPQQQPQRPAHVGRVEGRYGTVFVPWKTALAPGGHVFCIQPIHALARLLQVQIQHSLGNGRRDCLVPVVTHVSQRLVDDALVQRPVGGPQDETPPAVPRDVLQQLALLEGLAAQAAHYLPRDSRLPGQFLGRGLKSSPGLVNVQVNHVPKVDLGRRAVKKADGNGIATCGIECCTGALPGRHRSF